MGTPQPFPRAPGPTALDRLIGWISPRAALARHYDRALLQRAYEAASPRDPWRPRRAGASANADHYADAAQLRYKARALVQNVPYIRAGLDALVAETIGTGIVTYATGAQAKEIDALWLAWSAVCDADGLRDWPGMQAAAYRAMVQDGEVLIRLRPRLPTDGLPVPLQLQLLEIDMLDTARVGGGTGTNIVVNGIEYDALGRKVAYWLWDRHPGEIGMLRVGGRTQSQRVSADYIVHLFSPERPMQARGVTSLAPIIARTRDLQLYEDAEIARKNQEARLSVLVSGDVSSMANPASYGSTIDQSSAAKTGDLGELPSGSMVQLPPGVNVTTVAPHPAPGHVEYVKLQLHIIAAGWGVPYEMLVGDVSEVNFSSARVRLMNFRRQVQQTQWLCLVPSLIAPVRAAFIRAAEDNSIIRRRADNANVDHSTPKWDYVNPAQDADSELKLISQGLLTISESLRQRGYKPDTVFAEWAADIKRLKDAGTLEVLLLMLKGRITEYTGDGNAPGAAPAKAARSDDRPDRADPGRDPVALVDSITRGMSDAFTGAMAPLLRVLLAQAQRAEPQPPTIHVAPAAVTVSPPNVHVDNHMAAAAPPHVTVQPATPTIVVQPSEVRVDNSINLPDLPREVRIVAMPDRITTTEIERGRDGNINTTKQVESDAV